MNAISMDIVHVAIGTVIGGIVLALFIGGLAIYASRYIRASTEFKMYPERTANRLISWGFGILFLLIFVALFPLIKN